MPPITVEKPLSYNRPQPYPAAPGRQKVNTRARRPAHRRPNWTQPDTPTGAAVTRPGFWARLWAKVCQPLKGVP